MLSTLSSFKAFVNLLPKNCLTIRSGRMSQSLVNILIAFSDNEMKAKSLTEKQSKRLFDSMKTSINEMFGCNKYTIYAMDCNDIQSNDCWHLTTALVITVGGDQSMDNIFATNNNHFNGNHIHCKLNDLLIDRKVADNDNDIDIDFDYFKRKITPFLGDDNENDLRHGLDLSETNESKVYLITKDKNQLFVDRYKHLFESKIRLIDENVVHSYVCEDKTQSRLELTVNTNPKNISFDTNDYFSNLKTKRFGHCMAFSDITDTTMKLIESFKGIDGFVAIANQQTKGRGRTQNEWLSPKGCAMFTIQISIDLNSNIGRKFAFIQHLAGLSVIRAITTKPGYECLDLGLKWPNDILWRKTRAKISGVLVSSSYGKQKFDVLIGCGINVSNSRPSVCLNDIIDDHNLHSNDKLDYLSSEEVIARTVSQIESLLNICQNTNGLEIIEYMYTKHWIHCEQVFTLLDDNKEMTVKVQGLDTEGYLLVRDMSSGSTLSLHPDGNRFDIMRNLMISRKQN